MHPWSKFTPEEYARRRMSLFVVLAIVGVLVVALFVVQVRLVFAPPDLSQEEAAATESFFDSVTDLSERAGEAVGAFEAGLQDERKRLDAEQAITANVAGQLEAAATSTDEEPTSDTESTASWVVDAPVVEDASVETE